MNNADELTRRQKVEFFLRDNRNSDNGAFECTNKLGIFVANYVECLMKGPHLARTAKLQKRTIY